MAGDNDHHHSDGEDQHIGILVDEVNQVGRVEGKPVRDNLKEDDDDDKGSEDADLASIRTAAEHLAEVAKLKARLRGFGVCAHWLSTFFFAEVMLFSRVSGFASSADMLLVIAPSKIV